MKNKLIIYLILVVFTSLSLTNRVLAQPSIDFETGFVSAVKNDVRIPGDQGTMISFTDDLASASSFFYRIRAGYKFGERHTISALYAPLSVKADGFVPYDVNFNGTIFPADSMIDAKYKFNSYRLTYRYDIVLREKVEFGLGITGKIRDAAISMTSPGLYSEKTNVGFVPLINFRLLLNMDKRLSLLFEGDALAAPQGRAEDILIAAQYKLEDRMKLRLGYRLLEGGSDSQEVYNFSMFSYGSIGFTYTFE